MSRKETERRRAKVIVRQEAELRADLARLQAIVADCWSPDCVCHQAEWQELSTVRFLLGEDPPV